MVAKNKYGHLAGLAREQCHLIAAGVAKAPEVKAPKSHKTKRKTTTSYTSPPSDPAKAKPTTKAPKSSKPAAEKPKALKSPKPKKLKAKESASQSPSTSSAAKPAEPSDKASSPPASQPSPLADQAEAFASRKRKRSHRGKQKDPKAVFEAAKARRSERRTEREAAKKAARKAKRELREKEAGEEEADGAEEAPKEKRKRKSKADEAEAKAKPLHQRLKDKLDGGRFRFLNEKLYTSTGAQAKALFDEDPKAFQAYHSGYVRSMEEWSARPQDWVRHQLNKLPKGSVVADLGCGEAELARRLGKRLTFHSFDLVSLNDRVVVAEMSSVPLGERSADAVVFCLSLMGTDAGDALNEANRILKPQGVLLIAEIASRIESSAALRRSLEGRGFRLHKRHALPDDYFAAFVAHKTGKAKKKAPPLPLKPCAYKKR